MDITSGAQGRPGQDRRAGRIDLRLALKSAQLLQGGPGQAQGLCRQRAARPLCQAYWGHPAYKLPPEANLMAMAHYLEALEWQQDVIKIHAILGSKNPHPQTFLVGGMAIPVDPDSQNALNADKMAQIRKLLKKARTFVEQVYIPDLLAVASFYKDWAGIGAGIGNYMSYGEYPQDGQRQDSLFPAGIILGRDLAKVQPMDQKKIAEYVDHSWYNYRKRDKGMHPCDGETRPKYTGPSRPTNPRYRRQILLGQVAPLRRQAMEVGPLASCWWPTPPGTR